MSSIRFYPVNKDSSYYEHMGRYLFAKELISGLSVLDISSGEGYGSALLSEKAKSVIGADIDADIVAFSNKKYHRENLSFIVADGTNLPFEDNSFDVVVSFETIEHVYEQERFLKEILRVIKDDGFLIMSTPDTYEYSVLRHYHNEDHIKEFTKEEFISFLKPHFLSIQMFGQRFLRHSMIWELESFPRTVNIVPVEQNIQPKAMYMIAICGRKRQSAMPMLFGDKDADMEFENAANSLHILEKERDRAIEGFRNKDQQLATASESIADLKEQLTKAAKGLDDKDRQLKTASKSIADLKEQVTKAAKGLDDKDRQLTTASESIADLKEQVTKAAKGLDDKDQQLELASQTIENLQNQIALARSTIEDMDRQIAAAAIAIEDLKGQLVGAQNGLEDKDRQIAAAAIAIEDLKGQLVGAQNGLEDKDRQIAAAAIAIEDLKNKL